MNLDGPEHPDEHHGAHRRAAEGVDGIYGIVTSTPGLSIRSAGPGQTELEMRGLSSGGGSSSTVGFYLDETPLSPPANALNGKVVIDPDLFDLNRVEVLRGPQGALYGSGSMGGTVKLLTNQPNPTKFEAEVSAEASGTEKGGANGGVNAMVNLPIVDDKVRCRRRLRASTPVSTSLTGPIPT